MVQNDSVILGLANQVGRFDVGLSDALLLGEHVALIIQQHIGKIFGSPQPTFLHVGNQAWVGIGRILRGGDLGSCLKGSGCGGSEKVGGLGMQLCRTASSL
ncbi:hypothetical protein [Gluconobacter roseus]|uniref:hypothetical protein n=1 Tax=Gluconobacter roseus TaxID=586239 RepID=UPI0038D154BC